MLPPREVVMKTTPGSPAPDQGAFTLVLGTWALRATTALIFVGLYATHVPWYDEQSPRKSDWGLDQRTCFVPFWLIGRTGSQASGLEPNG